MAFLKLTSHVRQGMLLSSVAAGDKIKCDDRQTVIKHLVLALSSSLNPSKLIDIARNMDINSSMLVRQMVYA